MKKLIVMAIAAMVAAGAMAQSIGNSYIVVNGDADTGSWYNAGGSGNIDTFALGTLYSLTLGGEVSSYSIWDGLPDMCYTFDNDDDAWQSIQLAWAGDTSDTDKKYQTFAQAVPGFDALEDGAHTLNVYFKLDSNNPQGSYYDNRGGVSGQNYDYSFTKASGVPEPATMSLLGLGALAMVIRRKLRK